MTSAVETSTQAVSPALIIGAVEAGLSWAEANSTQPNRQRDNEKSVRLLRKTLQKPKRLFMFRSLLGIFCRFKQKSLERIGEPTIL